MSYKSLHGEAGSSQVGEVVYNEVGQTILIPFFCRYPGCTMGWPTRRSRTSHEKWHGREPVPEREPESGTTAHFYWLKDHHPDWPVPPETKAAWAKYMRELRARRKSV